METRIIENISLDISAKRILIRTGYSAREEIPELEYKRLEKQLPEMLALCEPKIIMGELDVISSSGDEISLEEDLIFRSVSLLRVIGGSKRVTIYAATIGAAVEERSQKYSDSGRYRGSLLWDSFGSEAAEAVARKVSIMVHQRAKQSEMRITARYSPGYGDLPVEENPKILNLLGADKIGISCSDANMLIPRKSTTGIIGWRPFR